MKRQVLVKALFTCMLLINVAWGVKAGDVLLETNFQSEEGWIAQGSTAGANTTIFTQDIEYGGKTFSFKFLQGEIFPIASGIGTECSPGYLNLNKNNNKNGVGAVNSAYFELPAFDKDVSISFHYGSSQNADRQWCVEHSTDGGATWTFNEDDLAPMKTHGSGSTTCNYFFCPTKFPAGQKVRLTVHSTGGVIRIYSLKVEEYTPDNVPPVILSSIPADGDENISPALREIKLNFSERVKGGPANFFLLSDKGTEKEFTSGQLKYADDVVTFSFPDDFRLSLNDTYYLVFEKGSIRDLANNDMAEKEISFKTKVTGSSEKDILSFKINNQVGEETINAAAGTVTLTANYDVDLLTNLNPVIGVSPFASIINDYKDFSQGPATYVVTAEDGTTKTWTVTITKNQLVQAALPVIYKGSPETTWLQIVAPGWKKDLVNADRQTNAGNGIVYYCADVNNKPRQVQNWFTPGANRVSFMIRYGNVTSNYKIVVQESDTGGEIEDEWTNVAVYQPSNLEMDGTVVLSPTADIPDPAPTIPSASAGDMLGLRSYPLKSTSQYVRWKFDVRTNSSFYFDDVVIENVNDVTAPVLAGEQPLNYANYSNSAKAQIFLQFSETVKPSANLIARTTSIKLNGKDYYEANILCQRGGTVVLSNLDALVQDEAYTIEIPADALVDLSDNAFAGQTIQFTADFGSTEGIIVPRVDNVQVYVKDGFITVKEETAVARIELFNSLGLLAKTASNVQQLPVDGLKGVYIVKYTLTDGKVKVAKVLL